jgi:RHS repeat-associated protein
VVKSINGNGHSTLYKHTVSGYISKVTDALGNSRQYEYNALGKLTRIIGFDGSITCYDYNSIGKLTCVTDACGGVTEFSYDKMWRLVSVTDPCGGIVQIAYDRYGNVSSTTDAEDNVTVYEHDAKGNVTAVIAGCGTRTTYTYDALDRCVEVTAPDCTATATSSDTESAILPVGVTKFGYDSGGRLTSVTDALGNTASYEYDSGGQLVRHVDVLGNATTYTYSPLGQIECIEDTIGMKREFEYHPGGRLKSRSMGGVTEYFGYDANGNITTITDGGGNVTRLVYDCLDRVAQITDTLGQVRQYAYDAVGNVTTITDANGNVTNYSYSPLGNVTAVVDAMGNETRYTYDQSGRLLSVLQPCSPNETGNVTTQEERVTTYTRNRRGDVISFISPLGSEERFGYDHNGRVVSRLDADGHETLYGYNPAGLLEMVEYGDVRTVVFGYNALRQLTHMRDWLGTVVIEPDALGRALKVTDQCGRTVGYEWDGAGRRLKTLYPDGGEVGYTYDDGGRLSGVTADGGLTTYSYDRLGRLMGRVSPDGTVTGYVTDAQGRLTMLSHEKDGVILDRFSYGHDSTGNITSVDKQRMGLDADSGLFTYGYDKLDRLVSVGHGGSERVYLYDGFGNRVASVDNGVVTGYTYDSANRLTAMEAGGVKHGYGYDGRGNLSEVTSDGVVTARYTFDATNRLTEAVTGVGTAKYGYNGMLARVMKTEEVDGLVRETRHTLDLTLSYDNLLMEDDGSERSFVWGNGLIAARDDENEMFFFHDHLGSPVRLTGSVGDTGHGVPMAYDEFGGRLHGTDAFGQPFGFTGYQDEDVTGLYYAQARYYEPRGGRFIAPDTHWHPGNMIFGDRAYGFVPDMGAIRQSTNLHTYVMGNPLRFVDRGGLWGEPVHRHDTKRWAIEVGFSKRDAEIIALANYGVDSGKTGPIKTSVETSYHFNSYESGDSRLELADSHIDRAEVLFNVASIHHSHGRNIRAGNDKNRLLKELGMGLHAIQDIEAHGNIPLPLGHLFIPFVDNVNYNWRDDSRTSVRRIAPQPPTARIERQTRYKATEEATKKYLEDFINRIGGIEQYNKLLDDTNQFNHEDYCLKIS